MNDRIARFTQALEKNPGNELARFSLAKARFDAGQFAGAKEHFVLALARKPDWMVAQILLGKCELALGHREAAKAAFTRALQLAIEQNHEGPRAEVEQLLAELN
jgi:Flp pilus assembly protein TadD